MRMTETGRRRIQNSKQIDRFLNFLNSNVGCFIYLWTELAQLYKMSPEIRSRVMLVNRVYFANMKFLIQNDFPEKIILKVYNFDHAL